MLQGSTHPVKLSSQVKLQRRPSGAVSPLSGVDGRGPHVGEVRGGGGGLFCVT